MKTYVALFRGINVGGHHILPTKELTRLLEATACADVRTYIQSGNVVFRSPTSSTSRVAKDLTAAVAASHGFEPSVIVLTSSELEHAAAGNPYQAAEADPKSLHLFFLAAEATNPDLESLDALKTKTERFTLKGKFFYLHAPDGFGTSRLAQRAERLLGVEATARNWRTVSTLVEMTRAITGSR